MRACPGPTQGVQLQRVLGSGEKASRDLGLEKEPTGLCVADHGRPMRGWAGELCPRLAFRSTSPAPGPPP